MRNKISVTEAQFSKSASMKYTVSESTNVAFVISSLSNLAQYSSLTAPINKLPENVTKSNHVSVQLIEKKERLATERMTSSTVEQRKLAFQNGHESSNSTAKREQ